MNTSRSSHAPVPPGGAAAAPRTGLITSWVNFWFTPIDPVGLHALRVLGGLLFLLWLLPFAGEHQNLFGLGGWFDYRAYRDVSQEATRLDLPPHLFGWSLLYPWGSDPKWLGVVSDPRFLGAVYWLSVAGAVLFTLGLWTRLTGVLTWVAVVSYTANPVLYYDADPLLLMLAFYLMVGYLLLGQRRPGQSLRARLLGPKDTFLLRRAAPGRGPEESVGANLALRLFQVHFAVAMVGSGLHKLQVKEWWNGLAPWFYLNRPFQSTPDSVKSYGPSAESWMVLFSLAAYVVLAWQLGFPAFAWRRSLRAVLLGGAALIGLACVFLVRLPLLGPIFVVACLGYLSPEEWRRLQGLVVRLPGVRQLLSRVARAPAGAAPAGSKGGPAVRTSALPVGNRS